MSIRNLALKLLNDDRGISEESWDLLRPLLEQDPTTNNSDIIKSLEATEGRFYLPYRFFQPSIDIKNVSSKSVNVVQVSDLLGEDELSTLDQTNLVTFGDATMTLITPEKFNEIVAELYEDYPTIPVLSFKLKFGENTLINLEVNQ